MNLMSAENFFEKEPCAEPVRGIIDPYQTVYIKRGFAVIPRTGFIFSKERAGYILTDEDTACVDSSSQYNTFSFQEPADGRQKTCKAVDGKHPDGSISHKYPVVFFQGMKSGKEDFHAPSGHSAC